MLKSKIASSLAFAFALGNAAEAEETNQPTRLPEVLVQGRDDSLIGVAGAASEGTVGARQLDQRPLSRPGEVLETVPGLIVTQHSGAGKANQFFLRGFNLDHGTDFATTVDGLPVNFPTHGHGQGYTDLNFVIPELVQRVNFRKGPYYADLGDFSSAGGADLMYVTSLEQSLVQLEGGSFGYGRGVYASSPRIGPGHLLHALELYHNDGPWTHPDDYQRINGVLAYSHGDEAVGYSIRGMGYKGNWDATDQVAARAVERAGFSRFDSLDPTSGGNSQRYSLSAEWHRLNERSSSRIMAYGLYYDLDLFSNFTYFLDDPQGDQFEQTDRRWVGGTRASHTWFGRMFERDMENTLGVQIRSDSIKNGLFQTRARERSATRRSDRIWELSVSPYAENKIQWGEKFRSVLGARADYYHFDVGESNDPRNEGSETDAIASPKGSLIFGPWAETELYLSGGLGFHSNDGRGVTATNAADPLVRTYGAEAGVRSTRVPGLQSTVALWWLDIDSELIFVGDAGTTEASRPSRRYGVEFANYYSPVPWMTLDADFAFSHARFRDNSPDGDHIPGSAQTVVAAGVSFQQGADSGFFGGLRLRYFGPRPLVEDNEHRSRETILLSARAGYKFSRHWTLAVEVFNVLDRDDHEIDYWYESRLRGEASGQPDLHYHPVDPISARVALTGRF